MQLGEFEFKTNRLDLKGLHNGVTDGPILFFVHGWLDNAASFIPLIKALNIQLPIYSLDLPGHGKSEHRSASSIYYLMENILDVVGAIKYVSPEQPVYLIGHSLGGIISAMTAASAPEIVKKLVLLDSLGPQTDNPDHVLLQLKRAVKKLSNREESKLSVYQKREEAVQARMKGIGDLSRESATYLCERGLKEVPGGYSWASDPRLMDPSMIRLSEDQLKSILSGVECDTCLICGEDGFLAKYPTLKDRIAYFRSLSTHIVPGGHHFHMDIGVEQSGKLIKEFINV